MIILLFACAFGGGYCSSAFAQQYGTVANPQPGEVVTVVDRTAEYNVKAVYLYNFGRYVEWPASEDMPSSAFRIGVFSQSSLLPPLQKLAKYKKVVDKRTGAELPIELTEFTSVAECRPCHILFIGEGVSSERVAEIRVHFKDVPVMLVGESPEFATKGGTAAFRLVDGGVRFDLNLDEANIKKLKFDAKLLKAANQIVSDRADSSVTQK